MAPVVDVHAHLFPQSAVRAERAGAAWFGSTFPAVGADAPQVVRTGDRTVELGSAVHREPPEDRIRRMDDAGVTMQVVSLLPPLFRYELPPDVGLAAARAVNDEIADMVRRWPDRFAGLATLPLQDPDASVAELERAVAVGLSGFALGTHVAGADLDAPALRPVFRAADRLRAFVLCHPANPRGGDCLRGSYLSNVIGNPLETTLAFSRLVLGGVLDEAPRMTLCLVHGGGYVAAAAGRLDHAYAVRTETTGSARPPSDYLRSVHVDSLTHDARSLRELVDRLGPDRVLLGSDYPADMGAADPVGFVRSAGLDERATGAVLGSTALALLDRVRRPLAADEAR